jgi:uncharacterized membrane protein YgcG
MGGCWDALSRLGKLVFRRELLTSTVLALAVSACAIVDPVDPRYDTVNRSLSKARNESILLNILRASHEWPLSFTTVPQVTPGMTNVTSLGSPSFQIGPSYRPPLAGGVAQPGYSLGAPLRDVIFGNQNNLYNQTTVSSSFSVSSLETGTFYNGLLSPVSLHDLNYFIRQGYSRELLFWLFADTVEVFIGGTVHGFQYNPPDDYGCPMREPKRRCFREFVEIATITGLSVEAKTIKAGGGAKSSGGTDGFATEGAANPKGSDGGGKSGGGGSDKAKAEYSRFCFDPVLAERGRRAMNPERLSIVRAQYLDAFSPSPICGTPWFPGQTDEEATDTLQFNVGPLRFKILTRSTNSIYQFLGKVLKEQLRARQDELLPSGTEVLLRAYLPRADERLPLLSTTRDDPNLLTIVPADGGVPCFVHTYFIDGDWCVPEQGASNTKRIFSLLAELLALKTQASELAITPAVRIINAP